MAEEPSMDAKKSPAVREQELLEERAQVIGDMVRANAFLVEAVADGVKSGGKNAIPASEYFAKRWPNKDSKPD